MKTPKRFLPFLAAAVLLVGLPGCVKQATLPPPPPGLCRQAKIVIVTYDAATGQATMSADDKTLQLSRKNKDFVIWVSPDGLVYVDKWAPELPFEGKPTHDKKVLKSGPPNKLGMFTYEAKLVLFSDQSEHPVDPRIEVME